MTKPVRKSARLISTTLGGVCWMPSALRRKDSTTMMRVKEVTHDQDRRRQAQHRHQHHELDDAARRGAAVGAEIDRHGLRHRRRRQQQEREGAAPEAREEMLHDASPCTRAAKSAGLAGAVPMPDSITTSLVVSQQHQVLGRVPAQQHQAALAVERQHLQHGEAPLAACGPRSGRPSRGGARSSRRRRSAPPPPPGRWRIGDRRRDS